MLRLASACGPSVSVQPAGKPISISTHSGDGEPGTCIDRLICLPEAARRKVEALSDDPRGLLSAAPGVAHSFTAIDKGIPAPLPLRHLALSRAARASHFAGSSASFGIIAAGVGQAENALPSVWRSCVGRSKHVPLCIVPERGQRPENASPCAPIVESKEPCDVLQQDEAGSYHANDPSKLRPQPPFIAHPLALPRHARRLAREATTDQIHRGEPFAHRTHVAESLRVRPVPRKHLAAPRIALDLPHDAAASGSLDAQL